MKLGTRLRSAGMRVMSSESLLELRRRKSRLFDKKRIETPAVHYFHQVDDPYSFLAVQKLATLQTRYNISFIPHLVSSPAAEFKGDETRYQACSISDARSIGEFFGVLPPISDAVPNQQQVALANQTLSAALSSEDSGVFANSAVVVGENLWRRASVEYAVDLSSRADLAVGDALQAALGHYFGAMFYYEGEWFWGLDRLHLLEQRLIDAGYSKNPYDELCVSLPTARAATGAQASAVTLEYFPSLRSPYTAVGHSRVVDLVNRSGVSLKLRPVMPMMMRGIPAPRAKQVYIMMDAAREARFYGVPFGRFVDPFGDPVLWAFSLFPVAMAQGKGMDFVGAYLSACFAEAIDVTGTRGFANMLGRIGLDLDELERQSTSFNWQALLQENIEAMNGAGLWGVPGFRVTSADEEPFSCWGQDRIWRVEAEIEKRASKNASQAS
ncbi:DsbA family protein [Pseudomonadales bacterium]|nr:DsbA family protein [Pseudomonadales bacterium]MDC0996633.1 DsbA family protein [Pseudomonadales bacterium]